MVVPRAPHQALPLCYTGGGGGGRGGGGGGGRNRREGTSEAAPEVGRQAVGGGCKSGWGAVTVGYECHLASGGQRLDKSGGPWRGGGGGTVMLRIGPAASLGSVPGPTRSDHRTRGDQTSVISNRSMPRHTGRVSAQISQR